MSCCARAATRSRAAPPRCSRTSSPSACSGCPRLKVGGLGTMDFGFTDDQREIQRTARDLLAERARPERVREHAEAGTTDEALWQRAVASSAGRASRSPRSTAGRGSAQIELSILCEELGRSLAPVPFLPSVMAATRDRAGRLAGAARALAAGPRLRRDHRRARRRAVDGTAELVIGGARGAGDRARRRRRQRPRARAPSRPRSRRVAAIDPTRSAARVSDAEDAGEPLGERRLRRSRPRARGGQLRARRRLRPRARDDGRVRQGPQAVRRARRRLPGGLASLRADAARHREGALDGRVRGLDRRRRPGAAWRRPRRWPRRPPQTPDAR